MPHTPIKSFRASRILLDAAFLSLVLLAYAAGWKQAPYETLDTASYVEVSQDLRHLSLSRAHQRTPGFPLLLLITGADKQPTRLFFYVSLGLHFLAVAILAYSLERLGVGVWGVKLFMLLASLPPFVEWTAQLTTETLSEFLVTATFGCAIGWLRTRRNLWMVATCMIGTSAALTRPTFQALVVVIAAGIFVCCWLGLLSMSRRQWMMLAGAAVLSVGFQASYAAVNYVKFGYFGTNILTPYSLSTKVAGVVEFLPDRYAAVREILVRHRDQLLVDPGNDHTGQNYIFRALPELTREYGGNELAALKDIQKLSLYLILHKPMSYLNECLKAVAGYWMPTDGPLSSSSLAWRSIWAIIQVTILGMFFLQATALTGVALFRLPQWLKPLHGRSMSVPMPNCLVICAYVLGSLIIWYTMVISCLFGIGLARYRAPTELLIMGVALIGFRIWSNVTRNSYADSEYHTMEPRLATSVVAP